MDYLDDIYTEGDHVRVCRVCLIMNVKMHDLKVYPMDTYFEAIIGIPVISTMELPPYICYECAGYVRKFYMFKDRCLQGQTVLYGLLQTAGMVTEQDIKNLDRKALKVTSRLSINNRSAYETAEHDENFMIEVKQEPVIINENGIGLSVELGCIKEEEEQEYFDAPPSSDDEPLSVHQTIKQKNIEKKRGRKKKVLSGEDIIQAIEGDGEIAQEEIEAKVPERRKKGRPRKNPLKGKVPLKPARRTTFTGGVADDDIDLEEYVTIKTLTLEEQIAEIDNRKESSNYMNAPYKCALCFKGFIDTKAWKHHLAKHDPSAGPEECAICKFRFPSRRALQKHIVNHEKKYACKACAYVSKTTTQAKQHQRWHKGVTYTCEYCDEVSTKWTSYLSHVRMKHPSSHICSVCGYSFVSRLGLTMHRTMMHKDVEKSSETQEGLYCSECDVKFVSAEAYSRHMVTSVKHSNTNNFTLGCRECGITFPTSEELRLHHRKVHARQRPTNYGKRTLDNKWPRKCDHCDEEIESARGQWVHFRRAHPDHRYPVKKDYVCDVCGKSFRANAFLTYHKRTHSEERAYKCSLCEKAFFNRTNLNMHVRTHSELRPYGCDVCCKAFKNKSALDRHYRSHTGERPYSCEVCGKSFGQSNSRKLHVRTVHLRTPAPHRSRHAPAPAP